jgi:hypothetical protein|tara:strand:- start:14 stop:241 length:228 start_codon:yes stop_codon:yes gene_type:complete
MTKLEKASKDKVGRKGNVSLTKTDNVAVPSQNLHMDPKGLSSFRGKGVYIAQGDKNEIKGTRRMLKSKDKTVTWF